MFCLIIKGSSNYITSDPGATYGLRLVLYNNQSDSLITMSPAAGFRVSYITLYTSLEPCFDVPENQKRMFFL